MGKSVYAVGGVVASVHVRMMGDQILAILVRTY